MTLTAQPEFQQCFTSVITEPKDLSVYTATIKNDQIVLSLNGASIYNVSLNGKSYTTSESEITLSLSPGVNAISISTDKACQGVVEKSITYTENARVYPNPFSNTLNLDLGNNKVKKAIISIFTLDGKQIFTSNHYNAEGVVQLDLSSLNSGLYMLKLSADNLETIFKIVKK
jgi:hypothetical protein